MNALVPFQFEQQSVRVFDRDGEPHFVLVDLCRVLGHKNPSVAARRLDDDERDDLNISDPLGREQVTTIVNESGLYRLILTSRTEAAKRFRKWVTSEVLPAIRRVGSYGAPARSLDLMDSATLHRLLLEHTGRAMASDERVAELEPKAEALARLTDANALLCITDAAKALDVMPKRLFAWLEAHAWTYRRTPTSPTVAFQTKIIAGYLRHKGTTLTRPGKPDKLVEQVMVTTKGLAKLAEMGAGR